MNRAKIKKEAKELVKENLWDVVKPFLILLGCALVLGLLSVNTITPDGSYNPAANLLTMACEFALYPISFGVLVYILKFVRKEPYGVKDIFNQYKKFWPIFALNFLVGLLVFAWSLLLIVPGIIAAIKYTMSMLIMADGEEDALKCIKKSKAMMNGYKWDYFVFQLSFIGWILLGVITAGIAYIFICPYINVATVLYYEELKKVNPPTIE